MSFSKRPRKNTLQCYTKPFDSLKNWNNRFFWVDERIFPTVLAWRTSAPKDEMPPADSYSSVDVTTLNTRRTPSALEKSPLDFSNKDPPQTITERVGTGGQVQDELSWEIPYVGRATTAEVVPKTGLEEEVATMGPPINKRQKQMRRKRVNDEAEANAPPKVLKRDHVVREIDLRSLLGRVTGGIYQPGWGLTNDCRLDTPAACQDTVDHIVPPGYFSELRHLPNADFLSQYNMNLARQVAMGSQLRLRFEQEVRLLKKARAKIARRDQRIQVREEEIKKLDQEVKSLKATETEVHGLRNQTKNLETLLEITGEEETKAAFERFKKYKDDRVDKRCAKMDARLDKLSVDFEEELYPHMLTAIAGHRWVIGHGLRLAVMKCAESTELRQVFANVVSVRIAKGMSEGLKYGIEHGKADQDLVDVEAYDPGGH
ncbi:hypothetical protein Tco_0052959 [Tanacetum coccineum]